MLKIKMLYSSEEDIRTIKDFIESAYKELDNIYSEKFEEIEQFAEEDKINKLKENLDYEYSKAKEKIDEFSALIQLEKFVI